MLSEDDHMPLVDKVLESLYPSGSTIKPSMAMALAQAGIDRKQQCQLHRRLSSSAITLSTATSVHGAVDMDAAVVHSCDIYFYAMCLPRRRREALADGQLDRASARSSTCRSTTSATAPSPIPNG